MHIPKEFVSAIYVGPGPWGGPYARPCLCGKPFKEDDEIHLVRLGDELMCCHEECNPYT